MNNQTKAPFKVGDEVVTNRFETTQQIRYSSEMDKFIGKRGTITCIGTTELTKDIVGVHGYLWPLSALTEVKPVETETPPMSNKKIPMSEIRDEVRELAVAWCEMNGRDWIGDKYKLASDVQNYADWYASALLASKDKEISDNLQAYELMLIALQEEIEEQDKEIEELKATLNQGTPPTNTNQ